MTKKEFKYVLEGTAYITKNGKINYAEVLNMIILANQYHAQECKDRGLSALYNAVTAENDAISTRCMNIPKGVYKHE